MMGRLIPHIVLNRRFSLQSFEAWHPTLNRAIEQLYEWKKRQVLEPYASLIISGPAHTGKTHLASIVFWSVTQTVQGQKIGEPTGLFYTAQGLLPELKLGHVDKVIGESWPIVVDDVGEEYFACEQFDPGTHVLPLRRKKRKRRERVAIRSETEIEEVGVGAEYSEYNARVRHDRYRRLMQHCFIYQLPVVVVTQLPIHDRNHDFVDWIGYRAWEILCRMAPTEAIVDLAGMPAFTGRMKDEG